MILLFLLLGISYTFAAENNIDGREWRTIDQGWFTFSNNDARDSDHDSYRPKSDILLTIAFYSVLTVLLRKSLFSSFIRKMKEKNPLSIGIGISRGNKFFSLLICKKQGLFHFSDELLSLPKKVEEMI